MCVYVIQLSLKAAHVGLQVFARISVDYWLLVPSYRLWIVPKGYGDVVEPQQIGYVNVVPARNEFGVFDGFGDTVRKFNQHLRVHPLPGTCYFIDTTTNEIMHQPKLGGTLSCRQFRLSLSQQHLTFIRSLAPHLLFSSFITAYLSDTPLDQRFSGQLSDAPSILAVFKGCEENCMVKPALNQCNELLLLLLLLSARSRVSRQNGLSQRVQDHLQQSGCPAADKFSVNQSINQKITPYKNYQWFTRQNVPRIWRRCIVQ